MRSRLRPLAALVALWTCGWTGAWGASARAAATGDDAPTVVLVVPQRAGELDERAATTVHAHLREEPCSIVLLRPVAGEDPFEAARTHARANDAAFVLWIELDAAGERDAGAGERDAFLLYVYERDAGGLLGRRVEIATETPSAALETLANVAGAVTSALLAGDVVGLVPAETLRAPAPGEADAGAGANNDPGESTDNPSGEDVDNDPGEDARPAGAGASPSQGPRASGARRQPAPVDGREGPRRMGLSLGYTGNIFASGFGWQSAIAASLSWLPAPGARVSLGYDFVLPSTVETPLVAFTLRRHPVSLSGAYRFVIVRGLDVELGVRLSVDPIVRRTAADQRAPTQAPRAVYVFSGIAPTVGLGYQFVPELRVGLFVGVEAVLSRTRYSVQLADRRMIVVDPYPLRVLTGLRLDFSFLRARAVPRR